MIGAKQVTAPDRTSWRVGRQWVTTMPTMCEPLARVAELVYAMDSKSIVRKGMRVRIPPRA